MSMEISQEFWPQPLAHHNEPYLREADENVIVAEITDKPINGFSGMRQLYTALVPLSEVDQVLQAEGGMGWNVKSWGPHPVVPPEGGWHGNFWIDGPYKEKCRYQALVHSWHNHNQTIMVPDNGFLMCYGLVPRFLENRMIIWDDPQKPVFDVVEVIPLSRYEIPKTYSPARVRINRHYLEDYASLNGSAVVAVFFEQRFAYADQEVAEIIEKSEGRDIKLPGRIINFRWINPASYEGADQLVQVWGCRLILKPEKRPVSEEPEPELNWPDIEGIITSQTVGGLRHPNKHVFVVDDVLKEWEGRKEFLIHPKSGNISYGGWWSTVYSYRFGRHHIAVELRKLYEGTPPYVIRHFHRYAVTKEEANRDCQEFGNRHIGQRGEELVNAFLNLTEELTILSVQLALPITQVDFCGLDTKHVKHHAWWNMDELKNLGNVIPLSMKEEIFLSRCMDLYQLFERLKPGPFKQILHALGFTPKDFEKLGEIGPFRLFGTICQFCDLAQANGLKLVSDFSLIQNAWDKNQRLNFLSPLFGLVSLRNIKGHLQGQERQNKIRDALRAFSLDPTAMQKGWGLALDIVYDKLIESLNDSRRLIEVTRI